MTISELAEFERLIFTCDTDPDPKNVPLIQAAKKARDHISRDLANPHKDKTCQQCNWTNTGCLNLGEHGEPFWMCHGCIKRMRDGLRTTIGNTITLLLPFKNGYCAADRISAYLESVLKGAPIAVPTLRDDEREPTPTRDELVHELAKVKVELSTVKEAESKWFVIAREKGKETERLEAVNTALKQDLESKVKLFDEIWAFCRKQGYDYGPLNELIAQMVRDLKEQIVELKGDRVRMEHLEKLIRLCPHAVITFNDDADVEDIPVGFSISVEGCETVQSVGTTLREAIDRDAARASVKEEK